METKVAEQLTGCFTTNNLFLFFTQLRHGLKVSRVLSDQSSLGEQFHLIFKPLLFGELLNMLDEFRSGNTMQRVLDPIRNEETLSTFTA
jgi:hypothetical protein